MDGALFTKGIRAVKVNVNPPNLAAGAEQDQDVTVDGVKAGDLLVGVSPTGVSNAGYYMRRALVQAANTVRLTWRNETAGAIDPGALDLVFLFLPLGNAPLKGFPR